VALSFFDAIGRGDSSGAAALFIDKGWYLGGAPCGVNNPCNDPQVRAARFQAAVSQHTKQTVLGNPVVVGNLVQVRWETRNDTQAAAGVERQIYNGTLQVQGDKLAALLAIPDLSDAQTAKLLAFQQAQAASASPSAAASAAAKPAAVPASTQSGSY